jgi:molybdate transport system substrate-binding protein
MRRFFVLTILALVLLSPTTQARSSRMTVFAAASLSDAMRAVDIAWTGEHHPPLRLSFAASSTLARQLDHGARANIFASADEVWMNWAVERHLVDTASRRDVVSTQVVLIVPKDHSTRIDIKPGFDLAGLLGPKGRLAIGDPAHVPAGRYAKQALMKLGVWDTVRKRVAPAGIVYATDAVAAPKVTVAGIFPADSHDPIKYPFAITRTGNTAEAQSLLTFIAGTEGQAIFTKFGFVVE